MYNQLLSSGETNKKAAYQDVMAVLFAGHETTSKSFCSAIYNLKKEPRVEAKLMEEINQVILENGKYTLNDLSKLNLNEKINEMDYLTFFIKEVLRNNPPAARSLGYKAKETIKLKEVLIPKNQIVLINIFATHFNPEQWREPMKFIPERFDPNSEYFLTADGKQRHPLSYCPFTFGTRTCLGKALAMMELKILIIFFLLAVKYEVDEEALNNPDVIFAMLSPHELKVKVNEVKI